MCCWFSTLHLAFQHPKIRKWNACFSIASRTFSGDHFHPQSPLHSPNWLQKCQRQGSWSMCFTADFSMCGSALSIICWQSFSSKKEEISTTSGCRLPELSQILEVTHWTRTEKNIFQEVSKKMYIWPRHIRQHTSFVYTCKFSFFPTCQVRVVRFYVRLFSSFFSFSSFVVVLLSFVVLLN